MRKKPRNLGIEKGHRLSESVLAGYLDEAHRILQAEDCSAQHAAGDQSIRPTGFDDLA